MRPLRISAIIVVSISAFFIIYLSLGSFTRPGSLRPHSSPPAQDAATLKRLAEEDLRRREEEQRFLEEEKRLTRLRWIESHRSVIEPVVKATSKDMDKLSISHDIAITRPVNQWTEADKQILETSLGQSLLADLFTIPEPIPNFKTLTFQQRVYKGLFQYLDPIITEGLVDVATDPAFSSTWDLFQQLESTLYPWISPHWENAFHINNNTHGRGIVICVGNNQFKHAATTIRAIRQVLHSNLPIEVFYIRENDLSPMKREYLETEFTDVKTRQVVHSINDRFTQFGGWAVKPYAILASSFSEVILMDADVFFFKRPDVLFADPGYKKTGALFFYDRTLFSGWTKGRLWLQSFLPTGSSLLKETRWWKSTSAHEQESGVVVINKKKALLGLLSTCKMNDKQERDKVSYQYAHGDKETFWIGFEMVQTPYAFIKSYGAVIGGLGDGGDPTMVCGNQLHLDIDQEPLWWNGGLLRDKNKWPDRYLTFTHFSQGVDWVFETSCIRETDKIQEFSAKDRKAALEYVTLDQQRRKDQDLIDQGIWKPKPKVAPEDEMEEEE
ncbi:mannosyltransferase putative-domain-containing protein [Phycomyces nitens]|nr:mannosyltransferase putative-domain-containing protein [Phycomyces nitens]